MNNLLLPFKLLKRYVHEIRQNLRAVRDAKRDHQDLPVWGRHKTAHVKSSDTLYILGAGSSINWLTDKDWETIASADSLSTNWFLCHPFVPTYYQVEFWSIYAKEWLAHYDEKHGSGAPPMIINYPHAREAGTVDQLRKRTDKDNQYFTLPMRYTGLPLERLRPQIATHARLEQALNQSHLLHHGGSLSAAISFGLASGYKRIVLVGIDLSIPGYFYDDPHIYNAPIYKTVRDIRDRIMADTMKRIGLTASDNKMHVAADPRLTQTYNENSVIDVVDAMQVWAEAVGARLEIANKSSSLAQRLPVSELVSVEQPA